MADPVILEQVDFELVRPVRHGPFLVGDWVYVWGIKGRYDEPRNTQQPDMDDLNSYNQQLVPRRSRGSDRAAERSPAGGHRAAARTNIKFNRAIGRWAGQKFMAETGEPMDDKAYQQQLGRIPADCRRQDNC